MKITGHAVTLGMAATRQAANDFIRANPPRAAEIYLALAGGKKPAPA